jgi:hypothetical protein
VLGAGAEDGALPGGPAGTAPVFSVLAPGAVFAPAGGDGSSHLLRATVVDRAGVQLIALQSTDLTLNSFGVATSLDGPHLEQLQRSLHSGPLAEGLDRLRQGVRENLELQQSVSISVAGVSLGLSLVYLLWLVRGGVLMGSYLSALPAWRLLDPLPVLARPDEEAEEDEEELGERTDSDRNVLRGFA